MKDITLFEQIETARWALIRLWVVTIRELHIHQIVGWLTAHLTRKGTR